MTGQDLIARSMKLIGALADGETPTSNEAKDALDTLNDMIKSWANERLMIYTVVRNTQTLSASTASYTIGSGGTINVARPLWIPFAGLILDTSATTPTEIPIQVLSDQDWSDITQKTLTSTLSKGIWYDYNWSAGLARIWVWPIPTVGTTQLVLYLATAITTFSDLTTDYTFPPGYEKALRFNLAVELGPEFGRAVDPVVAGMATESKAVLKNANTREYEMRCDPALAPRGHHGFNYRTGE